MQPMQSADGSGACNSPRVYVRGIAQISGVAQVGDHLVGHEVPPAPKPPQPGVDLLHGRLTPPGEEIVELRARPPQRADPNLGRILGLAHTRILSRRRTDHVRPGVEFLAASFARL